MTLQKSIAAAVEQMVTGQIHDKERYATNNRDLKSLYCVDDDIDGGFVRRKSRAVTAGDGRGNSDEQSFELILVASFNDVANSSDLFEQRIDDVIDGFLTNNVVIANGKQYYCRKGKARSWRLVKNQPAMFAGVLVHYGVLEASFYSL